MNEPFEFFFVMNQSIEKWHFLQNHQLQNLECSNGTDVFKCVQKLWFRCEQFHSLNLIFDRFVHVTNWNQACGISCDNHIKATHSRLNFIIYHTNVIGSFNMQKVISRQIRSLKASYVLFFFGIETFSRANR